MERKTSRREEGNKRKSKDIDIKGECLMSIEKTYYNFDKMMEKGKT